MIIVEGPDGAGKSRLCQRLVERFNLPIRNWGVDRQDLHKVDPSSRVWSAIGDAFNPVRLANGRASVPIIHDRLYFSEIAYGHVMRDFIKISPSDRRKIMGIFDVMEFPIIFCLPPLWQVKKNCGGEKQEIQDKIDRIYVEYKSSVKYGKRILNLVEHDYTKPNSDRSVFRQVERYLSERKNRGW